MHKTTIILRTCRAYHNQVHFNLTGWTISVVVADDTVTATPVPIAVPDTTRVIVVPVDPLTRYVVIVTITAAWCSHASLWSQRCV